MQSERTPFQALTSALRFAASRSAITSVEELAIMAAWNARASDATIASLEASLRAAEEREKALREERDELLSQISDCRGSHWLGRQDRKGVTPHLDAIWRGLVEVDDARQTLAGAKPC